jgi:hypothetical protein
MRCFWICCVLAALAWTSIGCERSELGPPQATPTTDPGGEAFSKPTKRPSPPKAP